MAYFDYLENLMSGGRLNRKKNALIRCIEKSNTKFDTVAFTGVSGSLLGPTIAMHFKKRVVIIRKNIMGTHSNRMVEGDIKRCHKYIIIDDVVESGRTIQRIVKKIADSGHNSRCVGVFLYNNSLDNFDKETDIGPNIPVFSF